MFNALLLICIFFIEVIFILRLSRGSKEWLYGFIIVNLLLISVLGGKLISFFGLTTNTGNVFYISVFAATYILIENFGLKDAYRSVWIGSVVVFMFLLMTQLVVSMDAVPEARIIDEASHHLFRISLRVALASIFSFIAAQSVNIWLYQFLRNKTKKKYFWLRVLASNGVAQIVDSSLFFLVAFVEIIPASALWSTMLVSYLIKFSFGCLMVPFLYDALPKKLDKQAHS